MIKWGVIRLKTLIACYSYSGRTLKVAKALQKQIDADLTEIQTEKDNWYISKIWGALRQKQAIIKPCQVDLMKYDALILCCPVWAGRTPPAINQYLSDLKNVKDKYFGIFVTSGGNRSQKATLQMRENLDLQGMKFLGQMRLIAKDVDKENYGEIFNIFADKFKKNE